MGWVWLAILGVAAFGALALLKVDRLLWSMVASALMLGAAGYALQGEPNAVGHPARPAVASADDQGDLIELRDRMLGRFTGQAAYLVAADAMTRIGDKRAAVQALLGGIRLAPDSPVLWTGLGTALASHDGDQVSPAALFAFQQAARLAPKQPAAPFFLGLAYIRAGDLEKARGLWARALALTPKSVSYHEDIAVRLALLDRFLAMRERARP